MDVSRPYTVICSELEGEVLRVLSQTNSGLTGRQVARLAGRNSHTGVRHVLQRFVEHGLVDKQELGNSMLYTLNREHVALPAVEALLGMAGDVLNRLRTAFSSWQFPPVHASLFGSFARRDGDTDSDIDLLIVSPTGLTEEEFAVWDEQIDELSMQVSSWTGNRAGIVELPEDEIEKLGGAKEPKILSDLRADSISIYGKEITELIGAGEWLEPKLKYA